MNEAERMTLAEVRGFLRAFEWVNNKADHQYSFEIDDVSRDSDVESIVANYFKKQAPTRLSLIAVEDRQKLLHSTFVRWLLAYLNDDPQLGRLDDPMREFSLSGPSFYNQMIAALIEQIESLSPFEAAYTVHLESDDFYACAWTDIVLVSADRVFFLHLDVVD